MRIKFVQKLIDFIRRKKGTMKVKYKNVKDVMKHETCLKLHLGCGTVYKEGWINIDNNSDCNVEKLDLEWDLRKPLPFPENSVDFIYNEHFLEHIPIEDAQVLLKNLLKVLKPNGVIRIAMPNLADIIDVYENPHWRDDIEESLKKHGLDFIKTRAEFLNVNLRWWGHKWVYDREELERRLTDAGFSQVKQCESQKSEYVELCNMETRAESTLIAEARK